MLHENASDVFAALALQKMQGGSTILLAFAPNNNLINTNNGSSVGRQLTSRTLVAAFTSAPWSSSAFTTSTMPLLAALCNEVELNFHQSQGGDRQLANLVKRVEKIA